MSFWKNLFGNSKKETQIIEEPEHDLAVAPPDDLMIIKEKVNGEAREAGLGHEDKEKENKQAGSNVSEDKKYNLNNKDSP